MFPNHTKYIRRPMYASVEITKSNIECKRQDLQPKIIPIPLVEQTCTDVADILPKDKKLKSNQKTIVYIKRTALPLVSTYCITTHKSQGQIAAIYVPLPPAKRLVDPIILPSFDYNILLMKRNKSQVAETEILDHVFQSGFNRSYI
ncbi:unnamed protein product [Adineta ricciae]|uniref:Uncharacterized protein n=1 Tax=Adineta ricciae TaxID=249248 RepID=A0A815NDJ8_ADIRI|nr:unnamed protein product [Adineta ricciae]